MVRGEDPLADGARDARNRAFLVGGAAPQRVELASQSRPVGDSRLMGAAQGPKVFLCRRDRGLPAGGLAPLGA